MHLRSLAHFTALTASPTDLVSIAAEAMFDAVGLRLHPDAGFPDEPSYDIPSVSSPHFKEVRHRLADTGLAVLDVEVVRLLPDTHAAHYEPLMEMAAELGAGHVIAIGSDPNEARTTEYFGKLCALAALHGLNVMLESIRYAEVRSIAQAHRIITESGATNGKILIDTLHFFRAGETPEGVKAFDPSLFPYIQICDGLFTPPSGDGRRIEGRSNRLFPGEGGLPLAELLSALTDGIPLSVEVVNDQFAETHSPAECAERAADSLNALLAGLTAGSIGNSPPVQANHHCRDQMRCVKPSRPFTSKTNMSVSPNGSLRRARRPAGTATTSTTS